MRLWRLDLWRSESKLVHAQRRRGNAMALGLPNVPRYEVFVGVPAAWSTFWTPILRSCRLHIPLLPRYSGQLPWRYLARSMCSRPLRQAADDRSRSTLTWRLWCPSMQLTRLNQTISMAATVHLDSSCISCGGSVADVALSCTRTQCKEEKDDLRNCMHFGGKIHAWALRYTQKQSKGFNDYRSIYLRLVYKSNISSFALRNNRVSFESSFCCSWASMSLDVYNATSGFDGLCMQGSYHSLHGRIND